MLDPLSGPGMNPRIAAGRTTASPWGSSVPAGPLAEATTLPADLRGGDGFSGPVHASPTPFASHPRTSAAAEGEATAVRGSRWRSLAAAGFMLLGSLASVLAHAPGTPALAATEIASQAQQPMSPCQASAPPAGKSGTLHVLDVFDAPDAHGYAVAQAARQAGFHGTIQGIPIQGHADEGERILASRQRMNDPQATPDQFLAALDSYAVHQQVGVMHAATDAVCGLVGQGAHDGALNISRNANRAELVQEAWNLFVEPKQPGLDAGLDNAVRAFGLDADRIYSSDPTIAGPETVRLQQALVDRIDHALDESVEVRQAQSQYQGAIRHLGQNHVSVVLSSGNEGELAPHLVQAAWQSAPPPQGTALRLPADFYDNPLSVEQTTTVGAVRFSDGRAPRVLSDSSPSRQVSLFADGEVTLPDGARKHGTSYSAPVVGAAMAHQHGLVENLTPRQAQSLVERSVSASPSGVPGPVLEPGRLARFLDATPP